MFVYQEQSDATSDDLVSLDIVNIRSVRHDTPALLTVDIESLQRAFSELFALDDAPYLSALVNAIVMLSRLLDADLQAGTGHKFYRQPNYVNLLVIIMEIPALDSPEFLEAAAPQFYLLAGKLPLDIQTRLARIWASFASEHLTRLVHRIQQFITIRVLGLDTEETTVHDDETIIGMCEL